MNLEIIQYYRNVDSRNPEYYEIWKDGELVDTRKSDPKYDSALLSHPKASVTYRVRVLEGSA